MDHPRWITRGAAAMIGRDGSPAMDHPRWITRGAAAMIGRGAAAMIGRDDRLAPKIYRKILFLN